MDDETFFVNVASVEGSDDVMELPCEKDGMLLLSTLKAQFPNATGLKYRSSSGGWRGVKTEDRFLEPPSDGWDDKVYIVTESDVAKRKTSDDDNGRKRKSLKTSKLLDDLIVLGLAFTTTQEKLHEYFTENCGELAFCELKLDRDTQKSRGFGFIRFKDEDAAKEALRGRHELDGRNLNINIAKKKDENPMKLFIGKLSRDTTQEDLDSYFSDYGDLTDVFVPSGRGFAFVTFCDQRNAERVLRHSHVIKGSRLHVTPAAPKDGAKPNRLENYGVIGNSNDTHRDSRRRHQEDGYERGSRYPTKSSDRNSNDAVASEIKDMLMQLIDSRK